MNTNSRRIKEAPFYIGEEDGHPLPPLTIPTSWINTPTVPTLYIYDSDGTDVTATTIVGTPSVVGQVVTWPKFTGRLYRSRNTLSVGGFTTGERYTLVLRFVDGSNGPLSCYAEIVGQD